MKMTFRWFGDSDPVPLSYIRQIPGMTGVATALYGIAVGEVWPLPAIQALQAKINAAGLAMEVIESVPIHETLKLGGEGREQLVLNYAQTLRNLAECGVKVVCYNFMPVFDWTRTELAMVLSDGSTVLAFESDVVESLDTSVGIGLPGWDQSYRPEELRELLVAYAGVGEHALRENLRWFLERIIPVARECGLRMALHPDDPPRPIFGLPRVVKNRDDLACVLAMVDDPTNGLTLCSGSLGACLGNDVPAMVREFGGQGRIHFAHLRNVKASANGDFHETAHRSEDGSLDMGEIVKAYVEVGFNGYYRPDHGRMIWGEHGKPGYGLFDRALGAVYLNGLWEGVRKAL